MSDAFEAAIAAAVGVALARWHAAAPDGAGTVRAIAVGWTTVDVERAETALAAAGPTAIGPFAAAAHDDLLGARCRVTGLTLAAVPALRTLVLLEPSAEGRLAGSLARLGEGPAVVWLAVDLAAAGRWDGLSAAAAGPFGPERLVLGGERDGRLSLAVDDAPGTIAI